MKYPVYEQYQDSGMEWLGPIPSHWESIRFRFLLNDGYDGLKIGPFGSQIKMDELATDGFKIFGQENVINRDFTLGQRYIDEKKFKELSVYEIKPSDLTITMMGSSGRCEIVPEEIQQGIMDSHLIRLRLSNKLLNKFAQYLIDKSAYVAYQILLMGKGSIMHGLNSTIIKSLCLAVPPIEEQDVITKFLNYKTAQIDRLIEKKQALIEKLNEKRTAMITRAVTKGLDESVPMKDSGVEWLGEIPEGWKSLPLNARYSVELGKMLNESRITGENLVPYLRNIDVQWDSINMCDLPEINIPEDEYERYTVMKGDLLVCEGGEVGRAAIVGDISTVTGFQKALHRLRPVDPSEAVRYMYYTLFWATKTGVFNAGGISTIAHLTGEQLRKYRFPKPSYSEQYAIASYLDRELSKLNHLIEKVEIAIEGLQEYRTALITAAVTGKIDVRNFKPNRKDKPAREAA